MTAASGEITKKKILDVAEKLFSEKGFNGTSVDKIAKTAGVNKALIYYHFKDKNDIIATLFKSIIEEIEQLVDFPDNANTDDSGNHYDYIQKKIEKEIEFMLKRKKIISVLLMESLKNDDINHYFFQCAEIVINHEINLHKNKFKGYDKKIFSDKQHHFIHEFFTGFIPMVTFVVFKDKWCEYFKCEGDRIEEYFLESFMKTHLGSHIVDESSELNKKED